MDRTSIIVAVSSPPGRSRRGLVRASGPGALEVLDAMLAKPWTAPSRGVARVRLRVPAPGLPALALRFPGPGSATGDDTFELLVPGNPHLLELLIAEMLALDPRVRRAVAGEFTARGFMNGRLTLDEAEGVAALIRATNDAELDAASRLADGALGRACARWAERLAECAALVEAGIDFTDEEDVVAIAPVTLAASIGEIAGEIGAIDAAGSSTRSRESLPRVVLVGAPNAGKSTLFNALLGRRRTVASPVAGTTRDAIEARWRPTERPPAGAAEQSDGAAHQSGGAAPLEVMLVDLPGLDTVDEGEFASRMRRAAERAVREADLVLWCIESTTALGGSTHHSVDDAADEAARTVIGANQPTIIVRTKCDLGATDGADICTSAATGGGLVALSRAVAAALARSAPSHGATLELLPRHRESLRRAVEALRETIERCRREPARGPWSAPEETAALLRLALDSIGEITGAVHPDELLDLVFSKFCIGK